MSHALSSYIPICDGIALLLQPHAEVVLHELETDTIAYIANAFSKRRKGDSSLTESGPELDLSDDVIGPYAKTNWDGRRLKSITMVLRADGKPIGLLCVNYDIEVISGLAEHLAGLIALPKSGHRPASLFSGDWREAANHTVGGFLLEKKTTLAGLTRVDTDELLATLDRKGIFAIRKAVPYVAEVLGCSRATLYNRLNASRRRSSVNI